MSPNRVAIVTGAAQGLGRAIALRLASDGLDVAVNDLSQNSDVIASLVKDIEAKGRRAVAIVGDVSSERDVHNIVAVTVKELGGLDVMVANAGVARLAAFMDTSVQDWDRLFAINARGTFLCYQAAAAQLIKQGRGGRIIGACSIVGKIGFKDMSAYSATKFAIRGLTQAVAQELGSHGITVNAYSPGFIDTPMLAGNDSAYCKREGIPVESRTLSKLAVENTPYGAMGSPDDIASIVSYIASPESKFMTGQCVNINGGMGFD